MDAIFEPELEEIARAISAQLDATAAEPVPAAGVGP